MDIRANPGRLKAFLADPVRPEGTFRYHELQGFLFALASAPHLVPPSEWLPEIFDGAEAEYASREEAEAILGAIMALYNEITSGVFDGSPALPADCSFRPDILANLDDDAPVSQWARGFTRGHQWLTEAWEVDMPDEMSNELGAVLLTLSFFASRRLAEGILAETKNADLAAFATTIRRIFPGALAEYALLGRTIDDALSALEHEPVRAPARPGRNEPCPCGSGRKYKKCCGLTR